MWCHVLLQLIQLHSADQVKNKVTGLKSMRTPLSKVHKSSEYQGEGRGDTKTKSQTLAPTFVIIKANRAQR